MANINFSIDVVDNFDLENPPVGEPGKIIYSKSDNKKYVFKDGWEEIVYDETLDPAIAHIEKKKIKGGKFRYYLVRNENGKVIKQISKKKLETYSMLFLFDMTEEHPEGILVSELLK